MLLKATLREDIICDILSCDAFVEQCPDIINQLQLFFCSARVSQDILRPILQFMCHVHIELRQSIEI